MSVSFSPWVILSSAALCAADITGRPWNKSLSARIAAGANSPSALKPAFVAMFMPASFKMSPMLSSSSPGATPFFCCSKYSPVIRSVMGSVSSPRSRIESPSMPEMACGVASSPNTGMRCKACAAPVEASRSPALPSAEPTLGIAFMAALPRAYCPSILPI